MTKTLNPPAAAPRSRESKIVQHLAEDPVGPTCATSDFIETTILAVTTPTTSAKVVTASATVRPAELTAAEQVKFAQLRKDIRTGLDDVHKRQLEVGYALLVVREEGLFRGKFKSFAAFCATEFRLAKSRAYELANAAEFQRSLSAMAENTRVPRKKRQIRPLMTLKDPSQRIDAWQRAVASADGRAVTEGDVRKAVRQLLGTKEAPPTAACKPSEWKARVTDDLLAQGYQPVMEQPLKGWADATDLYSEVSHQHLKLIETLTIHELGAAFALRSSFPKSLIVVNGFANSPEGLLYTADGQLVECFSAAFNVIARVIGALVEEEGVYYESAQTDEGAPITWKPVVSTEIFGASEEQSHEN